MSYDFASLSPADFEDLVRDLIGRELGIRFEAFAMGPDGGIDGRHANGAEQTVLQAKHYVGSTFSALKAAMTRERAAIDSLAPKRYILATSRPLTPANKAVLASIIGSSLNGEADILGPADLNGLLRKYGDIERAHIKLWLSGVEMLDRVVHSAAHTYTAITRDEIEAKVRVYAPNPSFTESRDILEDHHVLIVSGPPGVGKTTLAEMLSYAYIAEGWNLVAIRSLDDGFGTIADTEKQIFLFDDFLGKIALDTQALAAKDSDLSRFMKRVRASPNARFILTTRAYIFEEARRTSEYLADRRLDISKYVLDVGVYTRRIRARILYNHLLVAGTSRALVRALITSGKLSKIVDHRNYNPRVIEWMTDADHLQEVTADGYADAFLAALAKPHQLWDTAFRKHIPEMCRHLLLAMFFGSEYGIGLDELRQVYEPLHEHLCRKYGTARDPKDFEESLRILESGFITITGRRAAYVNPSFRDYMNAYATDIGLLCDCATSAQRADWAGAVWKHARRTLLSPPDHARLARCFIDIAGKFGSLPTWERVPGRNAFSIDDSSNSARISLLLTWWACSGDDRFATYAQALAEKPVGMNGYPGFDSWRDGTALVEIARELRKGDEHPGLPNGDEILDRVEDGLVALLYRGMSYDELDTIITDIEAARSDLRPDVHEAAMAAIRREIADVESIIADIDSESTLDDHAKTLEKLGPLAGVPEASIAQAVSKVHDRIAQIEDATSAADPPSFPGPKKEPDQFDDAALASLFAPLLTDEPGV